MTKTEVSIIETAARNGDVFLSARTKAALIKLINAIRPLKATHVRGNVVRVFFDTLTYAEEPEQYLTAKQIRLRY